MEARQRAGMLDEALEVIAGLWSGEPFSFSGKYYQVKEISLLPTPVQKPRIPIWIGGGFPLKGPTQRAARWDGSCLYKHKVHNMAPEDIQALKRRVESRRGLLEGYDIAVGGSPRRPDWDEERRDIHALAEAGAT